MALEPAMRPWRLAGPARPMRTCVCMCVSVYMVSACARGRGNDASLTKTPDHLRDAPTHTCRPETLWETSTMSPAAKMLESDVRRCSSTRTAPVLSLMATPGFCGADKT
jgi:hypothetical protein